MPEQLAVGVIFIFLVARLLAFPLDGEQVDELERVRAVLMIGDVMRVATSGIDRSDKDLVLSLLDIAFEPGADGTGTLLLTLAGDGAIRLEVECLDLLLRDVERPYAAPSGKVPSHPVTEDGSAG